MQVYAWGIHAADWVLALGFHEGSVQALGFRLRTLGSLGIWILLVFDCSVFIYSSRQEGLCKELSYYAESRVEVRPFSLRCVRFGLLA